MEETMKNKDIHKGVRLYAIMALACAVMFSVITFIIEPLSVFANSDITVSVTLAPNVIDIIRELAENTAFAVCYSAVIYAAVTKTAKRTWALFGIYVGACALRRLAVLGITFLTYSYVDSTDIFSVSSYFVFESLMMLTVTLVSLGIGKNYNARRAEIEKAARRTGDLSRIDAIDFSSVYSRRNPLQTCALVSGIMLSVIKLAMRIELDVKYTKFYGAPDGIGEILVMIVYYLSDILVCAIFYALAWLILSKFVKKDSEG